MKKYYKIMIIFISLFLITGCTKILKDEDNKTVTNKKTGQSITENILCQPENQDVIKIYQDNKVDITKLPKCNNFKLMESGYEGIWTTIFVKPLAWLILQIGKIVNDYGVAIIISTLLIRLALMPITHKTAIQSENMKKAKPQLDKLEAKYKNKADDKEAQMQKMQEMMAIYKKYQISPLSGCLLAIIQLPLFFAFLEAINRLPALFENNFLFIHLGTNPSIGIQAGNYWYILLIILIIGTTYLSFMNTLKDQSIGAGNTKYIMYFMIAMIGIASITFPAAVSIYWITSSIFTIIQNLLVKRKKEKYEVL